MKEEGMIDQQLMGANGVGRVKHKERLKEHRFVVIPDFFRREVFVFFKEKKIIRE